MTDGKMGMTIPLAIKDSRKIVVKLLRNFYTHRIQFYLHVIRLHPSKQ